jgi:hypothetical protein
MLKPNFFSILQGKEVISQLSLVISPSLIVNLIYLLEYALFECHSDVKRNPFVFKQILHHVQDDTFY